MSGAPPPPILPAADLLLDQYIRLAQEIVDGAAPQVRVCFLCVLARDCAPPALWVGRRRRATTQPSHLARHGWGCLSSSVAVVVV